MADYENSSGAEFWGDMGAGILPYCPLTKRFLLNLRSADVNEPHTYGIWGGKLDDGENDPEIAALRELEEETRYKGKIDLSLLCVYKTEGFEYHNYLGVVYREFLPDVSQCWESEGYKWVTLDEMKNMSDLHFGVKYVLKECLSKLDDIINESLVIKFEDFILEDNTEQDNLDKSFKGMGRFGMLDKTKMPEPVKKFFTDSGYIKIPMHIAGYDNVVGDQIYAKEIMDKDGNKEMELDIFIDNDGEGINDIVFSCYINKQSSSFKVQFKWENYKELIRFVKEYNIEDFKNIVDTSTSFSDGYNKVKNTFKEYDHTNYDIDVNTV